VGDVTGGTNGSEAGYNGTVDGDVTGGTNGVGLHDGLKGSKCINGAGLISIVGGRDGLLSSTISPLRTFAMYIADAVFWSSANAPEP